MLLSKFCGRRSSRVKEEGSEERGEGSGQWAMSDCNDGIIGKRNLSHLELLPRLVTSHSFLLFLPYPFSSLSMCFGQWRGRRLDNDLPNCGIGREEGLNRHAVAGARVAWFNDPRGGGLVEEMTAEFST